MIHSCLISRLLFDVAQFPVLSSVLAPMLRCPCLREAVDEQSVVEADKVEQSLLTVTEPM